MSSMSSFDDSQINQLYYADQESKTNFLRRMFKKYLKDKDFRLKRGDSNFYIIIKAINSVKDRYSFEEMRSFVERAIKEVGGSPLDFNISEARGDQSIIISSKKSYSIDDMKDQLNQLGVIKKKDCGW